MPNNVLAYLPASAGQTPTSDTNRLVRLQVPAGDRYVLSFSGALQQEVIWTIPELPDAYQGGTMSLYVQCFMATDTTGSINLGVQVESLNPSHAVNLETASQFDTVNSLFTVAVPSSAGNIFTATINLTHSDGAVAGDMVRIKLMRLAPDAAAGLLYVIGASLQETVSTLNIATFTSVSSSNMTVGPTSGNSQASIQVGKNGGSGDRNSFIELDGDDTNAYGLRVIRAGGVAGTSYVAHRGAGPLIMYAVNGGDVQLQSGSSNLAMKSYGALNMPAVATPVNTASGDMWNDSTRNARMINQSGAILPVSTTMMVTRQPAVLLNVNTALTQLSVNPFGSLVFPPNFFVEGKTIRWSLVGIAPADNATYYFSPYIGPTQVGWIQNFYHAVYRVEGIVTYTNGQAFFTISMNGSLPGYAAPQTVSLPSNFTSVANQFDIVIQISNMNVGAGQNFILGHVVLEVLN